MAKALQERLPDPFYLVDVDTFVDMSPEKCHNFEGMSVQHRFVSKMFHAVRLFADMGFDLVVPFIFMDGAGMLKECVTLLHEYSVLLVHVTCSIEELRRREEERGDRQVGGAEAQLSQLVPQEPYDVTVDTSGHAREECVERIVESLSNLDEDSAIKALWRNMQT